MRAIGHSSLLLAKVHSFTTDRRRMGESHKPLISNVYSDCAKRCVILFREC